MDAFYESCEQPKKTKQSPFADSPYESAYTCDPDSPKPVKKVKKTGGKGRKVLAVLCVIVLLVAACSATAAVVAGRYEQELEQLSLSTRQRLDAIQQQLDAAGSNFSVGQLPATEGMTPGQIYAKNASAVVLINATAGGNSQSGSSGSGFLISQNGYVVTNYHVIQGMNELTVIFSDGKELAATLVGGDSVADVALLKVAGENLPFLTFGSSDRVQVGEQVVAIGYPLSSVTPSLTVGYVSAKDQVVGTDGSVTNMLQTDAAINSGNSGGPLFNSAGQVIGINTAKFSGFSSSGVSIEGMSFAIPSDDIVGMIQDLREYGYVTGAYLGVYVRDVDSHVQMYGLPAGAYVEEATPGFAAEKYGILAGDVITALGGYDVTSISELTRVLRRFEPGDTVSVAVWRSGKEVTLSVVLDEKPQETVSQETLPQETEPAPQIEPESPSLPYDDFWDYFSEMFPDFGG